MLDRGERGALHSPGATLARGGRREGTPQLALPAADGDRSSGLHIIHPSVPL